MDFQNNDTTCPRQLEPQLVGIARSKVILVIFRTIHGFYLENQDSGFKEHRVSEDGDKKEGIETIL